MNSLRHTPEISKTVPCWVSDLTGLGGRPQLLPFWIFGLSLLLNTASWGQFHAKENIRIQTEKSEPKAQPSETQNNLIWRNGDHLPGELVRGNHERIEWNSNFFRKPFSIWNAQLERIKFARSKGAAESKPQGAFRIHFTNGDRIYGDLVELTKTHLTLQSSRFSLPLLLPLDHIARIDQVEGGRLRYSGPTDLILWNSRNPNRKTADWKSKIEGGVYTHQWNGDIFREMDYSDLVEIGFILRTPEDRPEFEVAFSKTEVAGPKIETWNDELVLTNGNQFASLMTLSDTQRQIALRIFWDRTKGNIRVCDFGGRELARLSDLEKLAPEKQGSQGKKLAHFWISNRTTELHLQHLFVKEWDGKTVPVVDVMKARVELTNGQSISLSGDLRMSQGANSLRAQNRNIALDSVSCIVLRPENGIVNTKSSSPDSSDDVSNTNAPAQLAWRDGSLLTGSLSHLDSKHAHLLPSWSEETLHAELSGADQLLLPTSDIELQNGKSRIKLRGLSLGGRIRTSAGADESSGLVAWQPVGASEPSPVLWNEGVQIISGAQAAALSSSIGEARLFLSTNEVLVGKLISIQSKVVNFDSTETGLIQVPTEHVRAIDLDRAAKILQGFGDSGWTDFSETKDGAEIAKDSATLYKDSFGHPSIIAGDLIRFRAAWKESYGSITMRLFASDSNPSSPSVDIVIAAQGSQFFVGKMNRGGAFNFSGERVPVSQSAANFEIVARTGQVEVFVNGKRVLVSKVDKKEISGRGLFFQIGGGWQGWNNQASSVKFSEFSVNRSAGYIPERVVSEKAKREALLIPRFHKKDPPTHLLLAPNGDLLRGKLKGASGNSIHFSSKGESLQIPRERVASILWLQQPAATDSDIDAPEKTKKSAPSPPPQPENFVVTHQCLLSNGSFLKLAANKATDTHLWGRSALLGECQVAASEIREMSKGSYPHYNKKFQESIWTLSFTPDPKIPNDNEDGGSDSPLMGKAAPAFTLKDLDESSFQLKDQKGKVVLLEFWASWCGPCVQSMPETRQVVNAFQRRNADLVWCAINQGETPPIVSKFLERREWSDMPVLLDFDLTISQKYLAESLPYFVMINKAGEVVWVYEGHGPDFKNALAEKLASELSK